MSECEGVWYLKAARYSASPMGGSKPPVKATLTLNPTPGPLPTCTEIYNIVVFALVKTNLKLGKNDILKSPVWTRFDYFLTFYGTIEKSTP